MSGTRKLQTIAMIIFATGVAYAKITGPDAGYTDAPGDFGNCTACHDTFEFANVGPGNVQIDGIPSVYNPGQQYILTVTVQQSARHRFGFQLTAIRDDGSRAGTLTPRSSDSHVNRETGPGGRQYIEHTEIGTLANGASSRNWEVTWTAPPTDVGTVAFHAAGNAANDDGTNQGDFIYTRRASSDSPTSAVTLTFQSQPGGRVLRAGDHFMLGWSDTGQSNIDNIEARYSTDDGATFPITNLIFSTTDATKTSFDWTVPNTPTTHAVLRLSVGKKSGDGVDAFSDAFVITAAGASSLPTITSAKVNGKRLFVFGENFEMNAVVELNGEEQFTLNDDDFSRFLRCKKAGKKIEPGATVTLTVRNPDGTRSAPFSLTRPPE